MVDAGRSEQHFGIIEYMGIFIKMVFRRHLIMGFALDATDEVAPIPLPLIEKMMSLIPAIQQLLFGPER